MGHADTDAECHRVERMVDGWSDTPAFWAEVSDDDHEAMQACEANPDLGPT